MMVPSTAAITSIPLAVVDVETTGLNPEIGDRVCEIAVLRVEPGQSPRMVSSLVNPGRPIDPEASQVNGLTDADVAAAPPFAALLETLNSHFDGAALVAHNARFDVAFLSAEYAVARMPPPDVPVLDTLALAQYCFGLPSNNLESLAQAFGAPTDHLHRAEGDVLATYHIFQRIIESMAQLNCHTLQDFLDVQGQVVAFHVSDPDWLGEPLATAVRDGRPITIRYGSGREMTERVVRPLWMNTRYLVAFCQLRNAQRTFRLDRIVDAWWPESGQ